MSTEAPAATEPPEQPATVSETAPQETPTTAADTGGSMDCADMWPEDLVQSVLGDAFSLGGTTGDGTECSFEALPSAMVLSWRPGGQAEFDAARSGASLTGDIDDISICNGAWAIDLGAATILEALGEGKILNATSSGIDDAIGASQTLLASAC